MALIHPDDLDAVVGVCNEKNEWYGTGFLYASRYNNGSIPFIVTNQHCIENLIKDEERIIRLTYVSHETDSIHLFNLNLFDIDDNYTFYCHPDKDIDIAVIPINYNEMKKDTGIRLLGPNISKKIEEMKSIGISEGDSVFVLGFPMGNLNLTMQQTKSVIVRNGTIARIRDVFYGASKSFLLDSLIFPGNSGGPVFLVPQNVALVGTQKIRTSYLIGVVREYLAYEDIAKSVQTGETRVIFTENSGLALVHPMDYVEEVINIFKKKVNSNSALETNI